MIVETATIYALSALFFTMVTVFVYFAIVFFLFYVIAWALLQVFIPIMRLIQYGQNDTF